MKTLEEQIPQVMILYWSDKNRESHWVDFWHRCRTMKGLIEKIQYEIKRNNGLAYRFITIHKESYGSPK